MNFLICCFAVSLFIAKREYVTFIHQIAQSRKFYYSPTDVSSGGGGTDGGTGGSGNLSSRTGGAGGSINGDGTAGADGSVVITW